MQSNTLPFCCRLYEFQLESGNYFLHEHPACASSWKLPCVRRVLAMAGVEAGVGHMCRHGMEQADNDGPGLVRKPTRFMTNAGEVLKGVAAKCGGGHRHIPLEGSGRCNKARIFPEGLCHAICRGLRKQVVKDTTR